MKESKGASAETWNYSYDQKNQLIYAERSQTDGGAIDRQLDFRYDPFGNRIEKSYDADGAGGGSAAVTRFAYDGWKNVNQHLVGTENWDIWADLDGSSSLATRYLRSDAIDQLFARIDSGTKYWTLADRLGSIREVIDNTGTLKDAIGYNAFGGITSETDSAFRGRYAWTGREIDVETGFRYNRARYYDPENARWITQDPTGFDAGDGNLYRYVKNAHSLYVDPTGLINPIEIGHLIIKASEQAAGLKLSVVQAPDLQGLKVSYKIKWHPQNVKKGGFIIQHNVISVDICRPPLVDRLKFTVNVYEAWQVDAKGVVYVGYIKQASGIHQFDHRKTELPAPRSEGSVMFLGFARYVEGINIDWKSDLLITGVLPASTQPPAGWNALNTIVHGWKAVWNDLSNPPVPRHISWSWPDA